MNACVLGHTGMVGRALIRALAPAVPFVSKFDLCNTQLCRAFVPQMMERHVDTVFMCAGRVGGIQRNVDEPALMLRHNLLMAINVVEMCHSAGIKLVYLGSSCIYPRDCPQPMKEEYLLTGSLEPTNEPYAIAKIAGIKLCEAFARQYRLNYLALMPCNLYGPYDRFDGEGGHVVPMLIKRFVQASDLVGSEAADTVNSGFEHSRIDGEGSRYPLAAPDGLSRGPRNSDSKADRKPPETQPSVTVWGTGTPRREIMHVDDFAAAALHLVDRSATGLINVGTGVDFPIGNIAGMIAGAAGYEGRITFDASKPDGMPRKVLDVTRMREYKVPEPRNAFDGIAQTVQWYRENRR